MRNMQRKLGVATGVAGVLLSMLAAGTAAAENARPAGNGLEEIPNDELKDMRGRYVVSDTAVALAHSLAGNSATVGYHELSALARRLEHQLAPV